MCSFFFGAARSRPSDGSCLLLCLVRRETEPGQPAKPPPHKKYRSFQQVASAVQYPALLDLDPPLLPADVRRRAAEYIRAMPGGSAGAYTAGEGLLLVRQQIAAFLERRDGFPADPQNVHLTTGATEAIMRCIQTTFAGPCDGVLVPCPQYPVYSFVITLFGGNVVYYPLDERQRWSVDIAELRRSFREATARGVTVRSLVAINPGNPCGSVLSLDTIKELLMFASAEGVVPLPGWAPSTDLLCCQTHVVKQRRIEGA